MYHSPGKRNKPANRNAPIPKHIPTAISCRRSEPWAPARRGLLRLFRSGRTPNSMRNTPVILLDLRLFMAAILSRTWLIGPALLGHRLRHDGYQLFNRPHVIGETSLPCGTHSQAPATSPQVDPISNCVTTETARDAEGRSLRIVHGAGRGMRCLIALVAAWRKAIQSFRLRLHDGLRQSGRRYALLDD